MTGARRWLAGLGLVTLGWLASPEAVPIYDGVGAPDEPYRFASSEAPVTAVATKVPSQGRDVGPVRLQTRENGPQLLLDLPARQLVALSPPDTVEVSAQAFRPAGALPRGSFDGNGYRLVTRPTTDVVPQTGGFVFLRAAVMTEPDPVIVFRAGPGSPWRELATKRAGRDILATQVTALGDYAVIRLPGSTPVKAAARDRTPLLFACVVVLMLVTITVIYLRNSSSEDQEARMTGSRDRTRR